MLVLLSTLAIAAPTLTISGSCPGVSNVTVTGATPNHAVGVFSADGTGSALCGLVGHTVILYRPDPQRPKIVVD